MHRILIISFLLFYGCSQVQEKKMYNPTFLSYMEKSGIEIRGDSLIFPESAGFEIISLPNQLDISKEYVFENKLLEKVTITRLNYTDYRYSLEAHKLSEYGVVTLFPHFHLGAEFRGEFGELVIAPFNQINPTIEKCVEEIGIGNYHLTDENIGTFITIRLKKDCSTLEDEVFKFKKTKA